MTHPTDALRLVPVPFNLLSESAGLLDCEGYGPISSQLNAILAAPASPLPEGGGWQDISTAPKDGTVIDLWASDQRCADCKWAEETPNGFSDAVGGPEWVQLDCDVTGRWHWSLIGVEPTHWMPLPAAPTGAK